MKYVVMFNDHGEYYTHCLDICDSLEDAKKEANRHYNEALEHVGILEWEELHVSASMWVFVDMDDEITYTIEEV